MKRFFFLISSLILLVSCTAEDYFQEKKSFKRFKKPTPSNQAFLRPVKPSESMQVGLPKTARNNFGADFYEGENPSVDLIIINPLNEILLIKR
jgi:hypothetical protein